MTAQECFAGKMKAGKVSKRAGKILLDLMKQAERDGIAMDADGLRQAATRAAKEAKAEAVRKADLINRSIIAQTNVDRAIAAYTGKIEELRATPGDLGFGNKAPPGLGKDRQTPVGFAIRSLLARDPWEIGTWDNVYYLARSIRAETNAGFAKAIEYLRPKMLGFKPEATRELEVLRALYDDPRTTEEGRAGAKAFSDEAAKLHQAFNDAGGALGERKKWRLPNPDLDPAKVQAMGKDGFRAFVSERVDRSDMLDRITGEPIGDEKFARLTDQAYEAITLNGAPEPNGTPAQQALRSMAFGGRRMLANQRDVSRFFVWKDADAWLQIADAFGTHQSVLDTIMGHFKGMADDIAAMRVLGPNPEATMRYAMGKLERETKRLSVTAEGTAPAQLAAATRTNRAVESRVRLEKRLTQNLYSEVMGLNRIPVSTTAANFMGDVRHWLSAAQLGGAIISKFNDFAMLGMTARMNQLPMTNIVAHAVELAGAKGSGVHLAQMGLIADTVAHHASRVDGMFGETLRAGTAAKMSSAVIRASGLRKWNEIWRGAFGLEMQAKVARERGKLFGELTPEFKEALGRYGIEENRWNLIRQAVPHEPREGALFTRPEDVLEGGTPEHKAAADSYARMLQTEMDYAIIERDPVVRSMMIGSSQPGTYGGEFRRSVSMYRGFVSSILTFHAARHLARGWDGSRLGHGAVTFLLMSALGMLSMQVKELNQGRDALPMDPSSAKGLQAWGKAIIQGAGLGVFGDIMFADKSRLDNTYAGLLGGPILTAGEDVLGKFLMRNMQLAAKGKPTHFLGDALFTLGRYTPGSTLWYARLAFQREVLDQAALMIDGRARERFQRIESQAREDFGQSYWWRRGATEPERMPAIAGQ